MVDQEISQYRVAEGSADERCHHRVSQGRAPLSQTESAKDSGHYRTECPASRAAFTVSRPTPLLAPMIRTAATASCSRSDPRGSQSCAMQAATPQDGRSA